MLLAINVNLSFAFIPMTRVAGTPVEKLACRIFAKNDKTNVCAWGSNKHRLPSSNTTPSLASYEGLFGKKACEDLPCTSTSRMSPRLSTSV